MCFVILMVMGVNLFCVIQRKSITNDEIVHIPAGYHYLRAGNFLLNPEHPPLAKMWAALPLLVLKPKLDLIDQSANPGFVKMTEDSAIEFWRLNHEAAVRLALWARVPMIVLTIGLGALIFVFGRQLFGSRAALFAVALFSLEPTMLAHGNIVHTDIAAALGYLLFIFAARAYYQCPSYSRSFWLGLASGFALLTKFSLIIVVPILLAILTFTIWKNSRWKASRAQLLLRAIIVLGVVLITINAAYLFKRPQLTRPEINSTVEAAPASAEGTPAMIRIGSKVIPTAYLVGLQAVFVHNREGHPSSLLGQYRQSGWWYYFPAAFALKTSLPFLLLTIAALSWAITSAIRRRAGDLILLLIALAIYLALSMSSSINIGVRHIAPVFPLLFLIAGAFLDRLLRVTSAQRIALLVTTLLFAWMIVDTVRIYPNYLSFTNPLTFGKANWQVLSDSNVEWGEDIGALARYLHQRGETRLVGSLSAGWAVPEMYDIRLLDIAPSDPQAAETRYIAVGAGFLNGSSMPPHFRDITGRELNEEELHNYFAKYRTLSPERIFGNSIYLYRAHE
jgi:4-amino-4-deoxy-L-arabinose transferase-like glycosyltransferase